MGVVNWMIFQKIKTWASKNNFFQNQYIINADESMLDHSNKIKLVAVAKDEGAYLSEWVFHHLYFGFDEIVIYLNNITDNSWQIAKKFEQVKNVKFKDGDSFFQQTTRSPQNLVYETELELTPSGEFTHIMFLDLDEYYTPLDFQTPITDFIKTVTAQVCCFEWVIQVKDEEPFSSSFDVCIQGVKARQVKSIYETTIQAKQINPHNIYIENGKYQLADGETFIVNNINHFSLVPIEELRKPLKRAFILHRMYRSELEYVASLKRGRPIQGVKKSSMFKDNRNGIPNHTKTQSIHFSSDCINKYKESLEDFIQLHGLENEIKKSQLLVRNRFDEVVDMIINASSEEQEILVRILKNVQANAVIDAFNIFLKGKSAE
jgi:hypothetical protein